VASLAAPSPRDETSRERELDLLVTARDVVADDVVALTLAAPGGRPLPAWEPGAHVDLLLDDGLTRQYSLCGDPADAGAWRLGVLREPAGRGGTAFVHDRVMPDSRVRVRGPRNHFALLPASSYLFIAGGIGITPILPMLGAAAARDCDWRLVYGGRRRTSMAFVEELARHGDRVELCPQDEVGLPDLERHLDEADPDTLVYCCGPEGLLGAVERLSDAYGRGPRLHVERFVPKAQPPGAETASFEIVLERSGLTLTVPPDRSIMEVCRDAGLDILSSCEEGMCCTCETMVLEGVPDHRDSALSPSERESGEIMLICVSRALSERLVLDL
jgi:ferredoxin-NADP reductase